MDLVKSLNKNMKIEDFIFDFLKNHELSSCHSERDNLFSLTL